MYVTIKKNIDKLKKNKVVGWLFLNISFLHNFCIFEAVCSAGYYGKWCDRKCPPGSFGLQCGEICPLECTNENCDHVKGCQLRTKIPIYVTTAGMI